MNQSGSELRWLISVGYGSSLSPCHNTALFGRGAYDFNLIAAGLSGDLAKVVALHGVYMPKFLRNFQRL
jgi:hypothetical protein